MAPWGRIQSLVAVVAIVTANGGRQNVLASNMAIAKENGMQQNETLVGVAPPALTNLRLHRAGSQELHRDSSNAQGNVKADMAPTSFVQRQSQQDEVHSARLWSNLMSSSRSSNFVDKDWSTGCVWGFMLGWLAAVAWVLPVISRGVDHLSLARWLPAWSLGESAEYMSGWAAFWLTAWLSQWFLSIAYCVIASVCAGGMAIPLGGHLCRKRSMDLGAAVCWSSLSACLVIMGIVMGFWIHGSGGGAPSPAPAPAG